MENTRNWSITSSLVSCKHTIEGLVSSTSVRTASCLARVLRPRTFHDNIDVLSVAMNSLVQWAKT